MTAQLKACQLNDLPILRELSIQIFRQTFEEDNTPENMDRFLEEAYGEDKLKSELLNPESSFFILFVDDQPAGYLKVNTGSAQSEMQDPDALEIERLYVDSAYQGQKLGAQMMMAAIDLARSLDKAYVWLGVWENNFRAQKFYQKFGFHRFGEHVFVLGDDPQTDYLMRLDL